MLELDGNRLTALDPALFARLPQLHTLDLSGNRLTALDPALVAPLQDLQGLRLDGNCLAAPDPALFRRFPLLARALNDAISGAACTAGAG